MRHYRFVDYATQGYTTLVALIIAVFHQRLESYWPWLLGAHLASLGLVHWLLAAHARRPEHPVLSFLRHLYPILLYTGFYRETGWLHHIFFADFLDPMVIRWEQAIFGTQPSLDFMERFPQRAVSEVFYAAYFSYYVMIAGVGIALYLRSRKAIFHYVSVTSFVFYCCYLTYIFLPVMGPRAFYRGIENYQLPEELMPDVLPATPSAVSAGFFYNLMHWIYERFESSGAAFPSSHVAIALVTLYFSWKYLPRIRYGHAVMVLLLCASTVYGRYHYVVDVLAGALTTAALLPLGNWLYHRTADPRDAADG